MKTPESLQDELETRFRATEIELDALGDEVFKRELAGSDIDYDALADLNQTHKTVQTVLEQFKQATDDELDSLRVDVEDKLYELQIKLKQFIATIGEYSS